MIMKLKEIDQINYVLTTLLDDKSVVLSTKTKFKMLTILKQLEPITTNISTIKQEKIVEYGVKDDDGNYYVNINSDNYQKFKKDMDELYSTDTDIQIQKFKAEDLFEFHLPSKYLVGLYDLIEEE